MSEFLLIPLTALSASTKLLLSMLLNPHKEIPGPEELPRDWRGLAHLLEVGGEFMPSLIVSSDPTTELLDMMSDKNLTVNDLIKYLERIGRWDVIDELAQSFFSNDASSYLMETPENGSKTAFRIGTGKRILTFDDQKILDTCISLKRYDAFLLYDDEELTFANEIVEKLEKEYNLKICDKNRDVIKFNLGNALQLITDRCNKVIVLLSSSFFQSYENNFLLTYALGLGSQKRQIKVIPCAFQRCEELPVMLRWINILLYSDKRLDFDFFKTLSDSIGYVKKANEKYFTLKLKNDSKKSGFSFRKNRTGHNNEKKKCRFLWCFSSKCLA